jgi:Tfp pilus assembly protein PilF
MIRWLVAFVLALPSLADAGALPLPAPSDILAIPPALQQRLQSEVLGGNPTPLQRFNRLLHLALDPAETGLGLVYADDADGSVAQTYASRRANCLSFTLLFVALARAAGLEATPQEIRETLSWRQGDGILYRTDHINTQVHVAGRVYTVDIAGDGIIALAAPEPVSDARLLAHHYNNLAMQHMEHNRLPLAESAMQQALRLDGAYAGHWSNAGVLALRTGDATTARSNYERALALDANNASALFNLLSLPQSTGDGKKTADYRLRLERVQQRDPFHHFLQAGDAERADDLPRAIAHYRSAIRLHRREPRFHAALAQAYRRSGDNRAALLALARARDLSNGAARATYEAQLRAWRAGPDRQAKEFSLDKEGSP